MKYIFVTGGVVSGLGKGITAASLGLLLKARGFKVGVIKLDPYINVDPGTMSPYQHGEVYVTEDGAETDLDLGHYERFINIDLNKYSNLTSGRVYYNVINKEREGKYLGQTIQVIPHVTNEIKEFIFSGAEAFQADVMIIEIGGTTGDIESQPFLEAIRQIQLDVGRGNCLFIHVTLVPYLAFAGEHKSKPTQHSVKELQSLGISPDIIVARSDEAIPNEIKEKIALFCNVKKDCVIENLTLPCLYEAPIMLKNNGLDTVVCRLLSLDSEEDADTVAWEAMLDNVNASEKNVKIALIGKYVKLHDAYLSVVEALKHAGYSKKRRIEIDWIDSESITRKNAAEILGGCAGVVIPGGFGYRGVEGKIAACKYARENNVPYLGLCLGMQIAVIEFARNVLKIADANSREFDEKSANLVIDFLPDQHSKIKMGGTLRLGRYPCKIKQDTLMFRAYGKEMISERHRHRYEFNNDYRERAERAGLTVCGASPDMNVVEAVELDGHDFFIGVQFHPEFKSRPNNPHPLFVEFLRNAIKKAES
jgi:CTP synthase